MMMNFIKNNYYRTKSKRYYIVISVSMTILSIFFAVYLTSKVEVKGNIAVVTQSKVSAFQSEYIKFTLMEKAPAKYQLLLGKYDGVITDKGKGEYTVDTIKNDDFKKMLEEIIKKPRGFIPEIKVTRGVGTNIIGYLLMFILLQSVLYMGTLAEDMELKQIERIVASPVSFFKYLLSYFIFTFSLIFIPIFIVLMVMKGVFAFNIGFSLFQYAVLLGLICSFGISFAIFINSLIRVADTANMLGSAVILLSTILSGSFYSFEKDNEILEKIIWILPQKNFLSFVQGLEGGNSVISMFLKLFYVMIITLVLFTFSIVKIKKDYVLRRD